MKQPQVNLNLLQSVSRKKHKLIIDNMFREMGGEYDRFRLENYLLK